MLKVGYGGRVCQFGKIRIQAGIIETAFSTVLGALKN
jgi:hypothetical protein